MQKRLQAFLNKPPLWFSLCTWFFPVLWLIAIGLFLKSADWITTRTGTYIAGIIRLDVLFTTFSWCSIALYIAMFAFSHWFRSRFFLFPLVWLLLWECQGTTQNALSQTFKIASGNQIFQKLSYVETLSPGMYFPRRCDEFYNKKASDELRKLGESRICENLTPTFTCRLTVLELFNLTETFRVDSLKYGRGRLLAKSSCNDSFCLDRSVKRSSLLKPNSSLAIPLSKEEMVELHAILADARQYYKENKYRDPFTIPRQKHDLLEFQIDGKYYFYMSAERTHSEPPQPGSVPTPNHILWLNEWLEKILKDKLAAHP